MIDLSNKPELTISDTSHYGKPARDGCKYLLFKKTNSKSQTCYNEMMFSNAFEQYAPIYFEEEVNRFYEQSLKVFNKGFK